ncbi:MAG: DUF2231 domain-containing protein [Syntrophorhabdaceae bacterium]
MASPASIARHPIHPMLVVFPIALWIFSFVCDLIFRFGSGTAIWNDVAYVSIAGGVIGALVAAVPGFIDFLSISGSARKIAVAHMTINLSLVVLFAFNLYLRARGLSVDSYPIYLSLLGVMGLFVSGWLGGHLVYVHSVAVECRTEQTV